MHYDPVHHPYPSQRVSPYARNGMVCTSQPLAAQAGLAILRRGGNAIDAAIATAAALTVVEPTSNGIGGDAFALVWTQGRLHGLNGSGPAPRNISIGALKQAGLSAMPQTGVIPVTVPGAPASWAALAKRFGKLPLKELLRPAIELAENGYPITPNLSKNWARAYAQFEAEAKGDEMKGWFDTFAPMGRPPEIGEIWRSPDHASTLQAIAETEARSFYEGELAEKLDHFFQKHGGYLRQEDLAGFEPEWVDPIHVHYRGYDVWELPPNGQGLVTLMALNVLKGYEFSERETAEAYHKQIEATKLAFADGRRFITDPRSMSVKVDDLLSEAFAQERRRLIGTQALLPAPGRPPSGGTVLLCTADGDGNMVSFIQSNYSGFGSGVVIPGTGIAMQNRGWGFTLDESHDNRLEPGKRPYHTIIPGFMTKGDQPVGPFGVMGGFMQPQGHVQVVMNTIDFGLNPQSALDAPRWRWIEGKRVEVEHSVPEHIVASLARRGHDVRWALEPGGFGRGQIIWRLENGVLVGGTDPRTDGQVATW